MRDPKRIERILLLIQELWEISPDLRLGQLLVNTAQRFEIAPYAFEDDELESKLEQKVAEWHAPVEGGQTRMFVQSPINFIGEVDFTGVKCIVGDENDGIRVCYYVHDDTFLKSGLDGNDFFWIDSDPWLEEKTVLVEPA